MKRRNLLTLGGALIAQSALPRLAAAQAGSIPVRIGWQPGFAARLYVARDQGLFEKAGLAPQFLKFVAGPPMLAALKSGDVDVSFMSANPALAGMAQGIDLKVILIDSDELKVNGLVVRKNSGIDKLADIRGKRIGVTRGSASYYGLKKAMAGVGLADKDIKLLDMPLPTWIPAFNSGDVDALWVWSPWLYKIEQLGGRIVATLDSVGIKAAQNLYLARGDWLQKNAEGARRFVNAMDLASTVLRQNPEAGMKGVGEALDVPPDIVKKLFANQAMPTLQQMADPGYPNALVGDAGLKRGLKEQAEFMTAEGFLKQMPDINAAVDPRPLQAYLGKSK
jgi:aliphatic sulfonates family ABC transporter substrate-binding protein